MAIFTLMNSLNKDYQPCSALILAAGKSSRMGKPKFALKFNKKLTFLEEIINRYRSFGCQEIVIVMNEIGKDYLQSQSIELPDNCTIVINSHVEWERFYSVKLGLQALKLKTPTFIHNVDNPFVNYDVLASLVSQIEASDYIVPTYKGRGGHPILLSYRVYRALLAEEGNSLILSEFLKQYDKKRVIVDDDRVLININTKQVYKKMFGED